MRADAVVLHRHVDALVFAPGQVAADIGSGGGLGLVLLLDRTRETQARIHQRTIRLQEEQKAQQKQAGKVIASPVNASATRQNSLSGPGQIVSTLIVPVGLWIVAAALVLLFGAVSRRLLATGVGTGRLVGSALLRGVVVAVDGD